tara:strand:+ start:37 stop:234 length:198 start_codon:yes stop_codon:yes gene_type:complete
MTLNNDIKNWSNIKMIKKVNEIKNMFLFYGFLKSPLTNKKIISLLLRNKTKNEIYKIGCNLYCNN